MMAMTIFEDDANVAARESTLSRFLIAPPKQPISAAGFAAWPRHKQVEFALLAREKGIPDEFAARVSGMELHAYRRYRNQRFTPYALTYSDAQVHEKDAPFQPHQSRKLRATQ